MISRRCHRSGAARAGRVLARLGPAGVGLPLGLALGCLVPAGCAQPGPLLASAAWTGDAVDLSTSSPVDRVRVWGPDDRLIVDRELPAPSAKVYVALPRGVSGRLRVVASGAVAGEEREAEASLLAPVAPPFVAEVQPAPGAAWVPATGRVDVPVWGEGATVFLRFTAGEAGLDVPTSLGPVHLPGPGSRRLLTLPVSGDRTIDIAGTELAVHVARRDASRAGALHLGRPVFPVEENGLRDLGRPQDALVLPSPAWEAALAHAGLGTRVRAAEEPWGWVSVPVENGSGDALDLVVSVVVQDAAGPATAFRPRLRSADGGTGTTAALLRVPAGGASAAVLPVFVDPVRVSAGEYTLRAQVTPLGASTVLDSTDLDVAVRRGDPVSSVGFLLTVVSSVAGLLWTAARMPGWLRRASTTDLMVNALFGAALFVSATATDVVAISLGALLGPFTSLLTGLLYDAGRTVLLATLLQLQPRPGTLALSVLCSWLGRGVLMGSLGAPDLIYTGMAIAVGEALAWLAGLTRGRAPTLPRLILAFAVSNALLTISGLWLHTVMFRLNFAWWYVLMQVMGPGFLYVCVACGFAVPFARSLRAVDA